MAIVPPSMRTLSIIGSTFLAFVLIGSAYVLSSPNPFKLFTANANGTEELLTSLAKKDADGDGLPDWQESLYGTDPQNPSSVKEGMTDLQAVSEGLVKPRFESEVAVGESTVPGTTAGPRTITDEFSRALFGTYLKNRGATQPTPEEIATFTQNAVTALAEREAKMTAYTEKDLVTGSSGYEGFRAYASGVDVAMTKNAVKIEKSNIEYFADGANKDDATALKKVKEIAVGYNNTAKALTRVPVPPEGKAAHLRLVNALHRMGLVSEHLASLQTDPLRAMLGVAEHEDASREIISAMTGLNSLFVAQGLSFTPEESGYYIVRAADAASKVELR
jgi:hypothetical protein